MQSVQVEEPGFSHATVGWPRERLATNNFPLLKRSPAPFGITNPLKTILTFAVLLAVAVAVLLYFKKRGLLEGSGTAPWPFYVKKPLTQPEQVLYHRLIKALPEHIVLASADAGLRLIRWHVKALPNEAAIQSEFRSATSPPAALAAR